MRTIAMISGCLVLTTLAFASEPGQPLDCSDWVMVKPGVTCHTVLPYPCSYGAPNGDTWCTGTANSVIDNEGFLLNVAVVNISQVLCGSYQASLQSYEIRGFNGVTDELVAYLPERCGVGSTKDRAGIATKTFDEQAGYLYVTGTSAGGGIGPDPYPQGTWLIRLEGFTTESEILQTYTPSTGISFRVPVRPEGKPAADHFDTYWGTLTHPIDFTQAHGLQCSYPPAPPKFGDFMTVADTLPTPAPGTGYYYVTATTYQGQTRYGRKTSGGRTTGRDPALLPACSTDSGVRP